MNRLLLLLFLIPLSAWADDGDSQASNALVNAEIDEGLKLKVELEIPDGRWDDASVKMNLKNTSDNYYNFLVARHPQYGELCWIHLELADSSGNNVPWTDKGLLIFGGHLNPLNQNVMWMKSNEEHKYEYKLIDYFKITKPDNYKLKLIWMHYKLKNAGELRWPKDVTIDDIQLKLLPIQ